MNRAFDATPSSVHGAQDWLLHPVTPRQQPQHCKAYQVLGFPKSLPIIIYTSRLSQFKICGPSCACPPNIRMSATYPKTSIFGFNQPFPCLFDFFADADLFIHSPLASLLARFRFAMSYKDVYNLRPYSNSLYLLSSLRECSSGVKDIPVLWNIPKAAKYEDSDALGARDGNEEAIWVPGTEYLELLSHPNSTLNWEQSLKLLLGWFILFFIKKYKDKVLRYADAVILNATYLCNLFPYSLLPHVRRSHQ